MTTQNSPLAVRAGPARLPRRDALSPGLGALLVLAGAGLVLSIRGPPTQGAAARLRRQAQLHLRGGDLEQASAALVRARGAATRSSMRADELVPVLADLTRVRWAQGELLEAYRLARELARRAPGGAGMGPWVEQLEYLVGARPAGAGVPRAAWLTRPPWVEGGGPALEALARRLRDLDQDLARAASGSDLGSVAGLPPARARAWRSRGRRIAAGLSTPEAERRARWDLWSRLEVAGRCAAREVPARALATGPREGDRRNIVDRSPVSTRRLRDGVPRVFVLEWPSLPASALALQLEQPALATLRTLWLDAAHRRGEGSRLDPGPGPASRAVGHLEVRWAEPERGARGDPGPGAAARSRDRLFRGGVPPGGLSPGRVDQLVSFDRGLAAALISLGTAVEDERPRVSWAVGPDLSGWGWPLAAAALEGDGDLRSGGLMLGARPLAPTLAALVGRVEDFLDRLLVRLDRDDHVVFSIGRAPRHVAVYGPATRAPAEGSARAPAPPAGLAPEASLDALVGWLASGRRGPPPPGWGGLRGVPLGPFDEG